MKMAKMCLRTNVIPDQNAPGLQCSEPSGQMLRSLRTKVSQNRGDPRSRSSRIKVSQNQRDSRSRRPRTKMSQNQGDPRLRSPRMEVFQNKDDPRSRRPCTKATKNQVVTASKRFTTKVAQDQGFLRSTCSRAYTAQHCTTAIQKLGMLVQTKKSGQGTLHYHRGVPLLFCQR